MRSTLKTLFFSFLVVGLFLGGAELLCRALEPAPPTAQARSKNPMDLQSFRDGAYAEKDDLLGYRLRRNAAMGEYRFNNLGFRGPDTIREKPAGVYRVVCIGGSTTAGSNAGGEANTYPRQLEAILRRATGNQAIEVLNAGVFGYHSLHSLLRVTREFDALDPDLYVFMDGLNDVLAAASLSLEELQSLSLDTRPALDRLVNASAPGLPARLDALAAHSALYRAMKLFAVRLARQLGPSRRDDSLEHRMELFQYRDNLERAVAHVLGRKRSAVIVDYPWPLAVSPTGGVAVEERLVGLYAFGRRFVPESNARVAARENVTLVDPQAVFDAAVERDGGRRVYSDGMHFTRYGNYLLAKAVYQRMADMPEVRAAIGLDRPVPDSRLDALFPASAGWLPLDPGRGCLGAEMVADATACPEGSRVIVHGLEDLEIDPLGRWRWANGKVVSLAFQARAGQAFELRLAFTNPVAGQELTITANGEVLRRLQGLPAQRWLVETVAETVEFTAVQGANRVECVFGLANGQGADFGPGDSRPLSAAFSSLLLLPR